jgi:hypothetical protein
MRTGVLLAIIGLRCTARGVRGHWEPACLGVGAALMLIGWLWPTAAIAFLFGMLVLLVTLIKGMTIDC